MEPILAMAIDFDDFFPSHSLVYWQYESKFLEAYVAPVKKIKNKNEFSLKNSYLPNALINQFNFCFILRVLLLATTYLFW